MKRIRPLHERLIIKENPVADKTEGGIFIPEGSKEIPTQGIIRALGNNANSEGENLKVGDEVMYMKYSGLPVKIQGEDLRMLLKNDILCVIEDVDEGPTDPGEPERGISDSNDSNDSKKKTPQSKDVPVHKQPQG